MQFIRDKLIKKIKEDIVDLKTTQKELAEASGVSNSTINKFLHSEIIEDSELKNYNDYGQIKVGTLIKIQNGIKKLSRISKFRKIA